VFAWQLQFATATGHGRAQRHGFAARRSVVLVPRSRSCADSCPEFKVYPSDDIGYFGNPSPTCAMPTRPSLLAGLSSWLPGDRIESGGDVKGCLSLPSSMLGEARFIEGNVRRQSLRDIWNRADAFAYTAFQRGSAGGFCRVCRYRDVCRGGCSWATYAQAESERKLFYHQVVKHRRLNCWPRRPPKMRCATLTAVRLGPPRRRGKP